MAVGEVFPQKTPVSLLLTLPGIASPTFIYLDNWYTESKQG